MVRLGYTFAVLLACATPLKAQVAYPPPDMSNYGTVAQKDVILDASGNATWDYTGLNFPGIPIVTHLPQAVDTVNPLICNYTSRTQTAVSVHCWRTSLLGLLSGLLSGPVTGAKVSLIARYIPPTGP